MAPSGSSDLLPRRLYPAEFVMLPFFWLAPLSLLVLGGAIYFDVRALSADDVDVDRAALWYFVPFTMAHLGTVGYRFARRQAFARHVGCSTVEFARHLEDADPPGNRLVAAACLGQVLALVLLLAGSGWGVLLLLATLVLGPAAVWRDLRNVRRFEGVSWGWPRHLHVLLSIVPLVTFVYLLQRQEHLHYALVVRLWDVDPAALAVDPEDYSRAERFAAWLDGLA